LRLSRVGDVITTYDSTDGAHWSEIGTARLTGLPHTVQTGLFVTSPAYFAAGNSNGTPPALPPPTSTTSPLKVTYPTAPGPETRLGGFSLDLPSSSTWQQPSTDAFSISGSGDIAPLVGCEGYASHWSGASIVNGTIAALLFVIVLATLFPTSEYRRGLLSP
jgi:hypothetical protein